MAAPRLYDRAYVLPNPSEHAPDRREAAGAQSPSGKVARSQATLLPKLRTSAAEAVGAPVAYLGNYPVMSDDQDSISWGNSCC